MRRVGFGGFAALALLSAPCDARAQALPAGLTAAAIDDTVERTRSAFDVPGIAVAVVHHGEVAFLRGYGRRAEDANSPKVDPSTLFAIGSNSKAFTTAALAVLVDEHRLDWNDRVIDHMPGFRLEDPWLTRQFRVHDLLAHHSGMGLGAGDLMLFSHSTMTRQQAVAGLPEMPFTGQFREQYAYNNLLYVTAGALVEQVSGRSWEDFVQTRLIDAAGLSSCQSVAPSREQDDVATGEGGDPVRPPRAQVVPPAMAPAGGIWCSAAGMAGWAQLYLSGGRTRQGRVVFSQARRDEMWAPHALLPLPDTASATGTHFRAYGYGWFMEDFFGLKRVWHTGTVSGMVSYLTFLPERDTAIAILTNHDDHFATYAIATQLSALVATGKSDDWVGYFKESETRRDAARAKAAEAAGGSAARPFITLDRTERAAFVGRYHDAWRGDLHVSDDGTHLKLALDHAPGLVATLSPLPHDLFVARWADRAEDGGDDCSVQFSRDVIGRVTGMTLQVIGSDFSFDVQDLHPVRVADQP